MTAAALRTQSLDNLYYNLFGAGAKHLPIADRVDIYLEADGFGDTRTGEARANMVEYMQHGWDWSHVRDASEAGIARAQARLVETFKRIIAEQKAAA